MLVRRFVISNTSGQRTKGHKRAHGVCAHLPFPQPNLTLHFCTFIWPRKWPRFPCEFKARIIRAVIFNKKTLCVTPWAVSMPMSVRISSHKFLYLSLADYLASVHTPHTRQTTTPRTQTQRQQQARWGQYPVHWTLAPQEPTSKQLSRKHASKHRAVAKLPGLDAASAGRTASVVLPLRAPPTPFRCPLPFARYVTWRATLD